MDFDNLPDYKVSMVKEVAISQTELEPLIQTDKVVYTPGQYVRFRILELNHFLFPNFNPVRFFLFSHYCWIVCSIFGSRKNLLHVVVLNSLDKSCLHRRSYWKDSDPVD
jgi:hypothetical protein